jgi:hypothetical protein
VAKTRDNYQVTGNTVPELVNSLNFLLQRIADRLDKLEGIRGSTDGISTAGDLTVLDEDENTIHSLE